MSKEFIKNRINGSDLAAASKQQKQLSYFTKSRIQQDITEEYLTQWAERKYKGSDDFINWIKTVFKTDNFLSFYKYLRFPLSSAGLINNKIKDQLSRVFFSEDSYFNYTINGKKEGTPTELKNQDFEKLIFNSILFNFNDILVTGLKDVNTPKRELIPIDNVVSIECSKGLITKISYTATVLIDSEYISGYMYIDEDSYKFYSSSYEELLSEPHDLGVCPADFIVENNFGDNDIIKEGIFTFLREKLEEYVFLKTLQRMTEPNGAIPVITKLQTSEKTNRDINGISDKEPMSPTQIGSKKSDVGSAVQGKGSPLQTGSIINVPVIKKNDGSIDMDAVKNFINFFYIPTESLNYLNTRIKELESDIVTSVVGDYSEQNESAKNEMQVSKSFVSKEDKLRKLSLTLSRIRNISDYKFLALKYGKDRVEVNVFYGTDFFNESQDYIYKLLETSPNPIETKDLLIRLSKNRNRFNSNKTKRDIILYDLLPYSNSKDFYIAVEKDTIDSITFQYQTRFNYYINLFESNYGDIVYFYDLMDGKKAEKINLINKLIIELITQT